MVTKSLLQTRIDADVKVRATVVLDDIGLTDLDVMKIDLERLADEGALPSGLTVDAAEYDAWFRAKVQQALDDPRPAVLHEKVEAHFAKRRSAALLKAGEDDT